ncbi:callose synthase 10, partial [Tanacetum coccineum]
MRSEMKIVLSIFLVMSLVLIVSGEERKSPQDREHPDKDLGANAVRQRRGRGTRVVVIVIEVKLTVKIDCSNDYGVLNILVVHAKNSACSSLGTLAVFLTDSSSSWLNTGLALLNSDEHVLCSFCLLAAPLFLCLGVCLLEAWSFFFSSLVVCPPTEMAIIVALLLLLCPLPPFLHPWNQRENIVLSIANAQSRLGIPVESDPTIDERAVTEVFLKVLDNYIKWCKYLRKRVVWGEAANVVFFLSAYAICFIMELDATLDSGEARPAASCVGEHTSVSFLAHEAARNNNGKAAHSAWRNYDDFNEHFWSPACFELSWPMKKKSPFLRWPKKTKRTGKSTFVEHRTFLHLYRSFHRLKIVAFNDGKLNQDTFKLLLSIGPTYAILKFIEYCLDVLLMFGAYSTARGMVISRFVISVTLFSWNPSLKETARHQCTMLTSSTRLLIPEKSLQRSFGRSFNGFAAYVTEAEVQKLKRLPGVESVFLCRKLYPQTTRSMDYIQLSDGIARNPGVASDITIGVIDSGIWPESPSFKDDGLVPFLRNGRENVKVALTSFATRARYYSIDDLSSISARDRTGHGTHVASIVAGNYVKGASYYGIADGVAKGGVPSARLALYKVCDVVCHTTDLLSAFDDAIADGVDLLLHAVRRNILTSVSAGNEGPVLGSIQNSALWMLTAGASDIDRRILAKVLLGNGAILVGQGVNAF